ncbi:MAG: AMIN domain-containing protein [Myxococcaceae bacterium]
MNRWIVAIVASALIGLVAGLSQIQLTSPAARPSPVSRPLPSGEVSAQPVEFTEVEEPAVPELIAISDALESPEQWLDLNDEPVAPAKTVQHSWVWRAKPAPVAAPARHPLKPVPLAGAIAIGATRGIDAKHLTEARAAPSLARPEHDGKPESIAVPGGALKTIHLVRAGKGFRFDFDVAKGSKLIHLTTLKDPSRLAIDLAGAAPKKPMVVAGLDGIQRVRLARFGNGTRVVLDLTMPVTVVEQSGTHVVVAPE